MQTKGKENIGKSYGTWTSLGFEHIKGQLPLMRLKSRLLNSEANRNGSYFNTETQREYEESSRQAEQDKNRAHSERQVIILPSRDSFEISTSEAPEVLEFALKDQAGKYIELNGVPITVYPVNKKIVDKQDGTLLTQMWFGDLDFGFDFDGDGNLSDDSGARGVKVSAEGTQKILPYSLKELSN